MSIENSSSAKTLSVPVSLGDVDKDLAEIGLGKPFVISIDPVNLLRIGDTPMLESSTIQWISTLWRSACSDSIEIGQLEGEDQQLKQLVPSAPGVFLALLPSGKIKGVSRHLAAAFRKQFIEHQSHWPDLAVSNSAFLVCLDSYPKGGLSRKLYADPSKGQVTDWEGFRLLVYDLINSVVEESKIRGEISKRVDNISSILFELFKNTHDHARMGVDGSVIGDSVRGIYSRFYPIENIARSFKEIKGLPEETDALDHYFHNILKSRRVSQPRVVAKRDLSGFLELSVFDAGPGMAARWIGRDVSNFDPKEQYDAVIHCLSKGNSSSFTRGRGFGLWRVLQELKKVRGFIRIRTNRVHVYRQYAIYENLHMERHADGHETPQEKFYDWRKLYTSSPSEYPPINGTIISIMLPLGEL